mmetsp:Transcript_84924/g.166175  ORF Transcript_84924/g.166175 Transcript_84924/m.166175 type:complete len:253 (-) Transcript_84924:414-1172(-)
MDELRLVNPEHLDRGYRRDRFVGYRIARIFQAILVHDVKVHVRGQVPGSAEGGRGLIGVRKLAQAPFEPYPAGFSLAAALCDAIAGGDVAKLRELANVVRRFLRQVLVLEDLKLSDLVPEALELQLGVQCRREERQHRVLLRMRLPRVEHVPQERLHRGLQLLGGPTLLQIPHVHAHLRHVVAEKALTLRKLEKRLGDEGDADRERGEGEEHEDHYINSLGLVLGRNLGGHRSHHAESPVKAENVLLGAIAV